MENLVLILNIILAVLLIGSVLLQAKSTCLLRFGHQLEKMYKTALWYLDPAELHHLLFADLQKM